MRKTGRAKSATQETASSVWVKSLLHKLGEPVAIRMMFGRRDSGYMIVRRAGPVLYTNPDSPVPVQKWVPYPEQGKHRKPTCRSYPGRTAIDGLPGRSYRGTTAILPSNGGPAFAQVTDGNGFLDQDGLRVFACHMTQACGVCHRRLERRP